MIFNKLIHTYCTTLMCFSLSVINLICVSMIHLKMTLIRLRIIILLNCLLILISNMSCRTQAEKDINGIRKPLENTINNACNIIQNEKLTNEQKINQINIKLVQIDSLSKIWENKIESYRTTLSEKELDKIENENRLLSEKLAKTIIKEMPEYNDIFKRLLILQ